jgi:hypothetical protein
VQGRGPEPARNKRTVWGRVFFRRGCGNHKDPVRPDAELRAALRVDAVANRKDGIEIIEADSAAYPPVSFLLNYRGFLGSCRFLQLAFLVYVAEVQTDCVGVLFKEQRHLPLAQPEGIPVKLDLQFGLAFRCLVDDDLAFIFHG